MKFTRKENCILTEIYRRLFYFHNGKVNTELLLPEFPNKVKSLIKKGILKANTIETKKIINWYNLTEYGKSLFSQLKMKKLSPERNVELFNMVLNGDSIHFNNVFSETIFKKV